MLSHILLAQDAEISLRQSAGFVLKKYVKEHWSIAFQTFLGSPPDAQVSGGRLTSPSTSTSISVRTHVDVLGSPVDLSSNHPSHRPKKASDKQS